MGSNNDMYVLRTCVIKNCTSMRPWSTKYHRYLQKGGKVFFRFPMDPVKRDRWIRAISSSVRPRDIRLLYDDKIESYICEDHFNLELDMLNFQEYMEAKRYTEFTTLYLKGDIVPSKQLNPHYVLYNDPNCSHLLEHDYSLMVYIHSSNVGAESSSSIKPENNLVNTHDTSKTSNENCFMSKAEALGIKSERLNAADYFETNECHFSEDTQLSVNRMSDGSETISVNSLEIIQCDYCPHEFCYKSDLVQHVQANHLYIGPEEFRCNHCPASFFKENTLLDHVSIAHKDESRVDSVSSNTKDNLILPETIGFNNAAGKLMISGVTSQTTLKNNSNEGSKEKTKCATGKSQGTSINNIRNRLAQPSSDRSKTLLRRRSNQSQKKKSKDFIYLFPISKVTRTGKTQVSQTKNKCNRPLVQESINPGVAPEPRLEGNSKKRKQRRKKEPPIKTCFVPTCDNDSKNTEKIFFKVPKLCKRWFLAVNREFPKEHRTLFYCCEDHFDLKEDAIAEGDKLILKKPVLPHKCNEFFEKFLISYPRQGKAGTKPLTKNENAKRKRRRRADLAYKGRRNQSTNSQRGKEPLERKTETGRLEGRSEVTLDNAHCKPSALRKSNRIRAKSLHTDDHSESGPSKKLTKQEDVKTGLCCLTKDDDVVAPRSIPTDPLPQFASVTSEIATSPSPTKGFNLDEFEKHEQLFKNLLDGMARMRNRKDTHTVTDCSVTAATHPGKATPDKETPILKQLVIRLERLTSHAVPMKITDVNKEESTPSRKSFDLQQFEQHEQSHENILNHKEDESVFDDNALLKPLKEIKVEIINERVRCLKCPEMIPEGHVLCQRCRDEVLVTAVTIDPDDVDATTNESVVDEGPNEAEPNDIDHKQTEKVTNEEVTSEISTKDKKIKRKFCEICQIQYTRRVDWNRHMKEKHGGGNFNCEDCGAKFTHRRYWMTHSRQEHLVERQVKNKPLACDVCQEDFRNKTVLKAHAKLSHLGSAYCQLCNSVFKTAELLDNHLRSNHQLKYKEPDKFCGQVYRNKKLQQNGESTNTLPKTIKMCTYCPLLFSSQESLECHAADCIQSKIQFEIKVEPADSDAEDWCIK